MALTPRAVLVLLAGGGVEGGLVDAAHGALAAIVTGTGPAGPAAVDQRVADALVVVAVGAALVAWTGWCLTLLGTLHRPGTRPSRSRWGRTAAAVLGASAATLAVATPAVGDRSDPPPQPAAAGLDLDGLPLPDLPRSDVPRTHPGVSTPPHVVAAGDSLWTIAAGRLPPSAPPAAVDRAWRRWYAANRPVIGPDPDLILPGQLLFPPPIRKANR